MKNLKLMMITLLVATLTMIMSCTKELTCDCTYYSEESTTLKPAWTTTYESDWDGCEEKDFGTSTYTSTYNGDVTKTHTYVSCK